ncbi:MAG: hypothetical protein KDD69_07795 [Bdellovibrionales bacterium]|nr:hypothetical protein [Bdellovibrionales bacterium]
MIFLTGYDRDIVFPKHLLDCPMLSKPFKHRDLHQLLLVELRDDGPTEEPAQHPTEQDA